MPVYEYDALDAKGKHISGIIDADSTSAARQKLRASRIYPVSITETRRDIDTKGTKRFSLSDVYSRIRTSDIALMTRQLASLVGAGFPLVSALDTLVGQTRSRAFKKHMAQIKDSVMEGNSFAASLAMFPNTFTPLYINMVAAGEASGTLEIVLERLADITEKQLEIRSKILRALAYPIIMLVIGMGILFFLMAAIVPRITAIFMDMDQVLPWPTRALIFTSDMVKSWWWLFVLVLIGIGIGFSKFQKTPKGRYVMDRMKLRLPGIGSLVRKLAVARFARTLGSLLENGVSMLTALEIVKNIVGNVLLSDAIDQAARDVGKGQGLGQSLGERQLFPDLAIQMIQVGEQTGDLEPMLYKIAEVYENEVESAILTMMALMEPLIIVMMAFVVGFIAISICLPIFEMNRMVR